MNEDFPPLGSASSAAPSPSSAPSPSPAPTPTTPSAVKQKPLNVGAPEFVPSSFAQITPAEQYNNAVHAFDEMFPSLGGARGSSSTSPPRNANAAGSSSSPPSNGTDLGFVAKQRLLSLGEKFGWVSRENILQIFQAHQQALQPSEDYLNLHFPRPANYIEPKVVRPSNGYMPFASNSGRTREIGPWVPTGRAVGALYEELREEASVYAGMRNACYDRARKAKMAGSNSEAARLSADGKKYGLLMFEKHSEAARIIYAGLHISEALERLPDAINSTGVHLRSVRVLTGSGHHTKGTGEARLRPAVEEWLQANRYRYETVEDKNSHVGAFVVMKN